MLARGLLLPCFALATACAAGCTAPAVEPDLASSRVAARVPALVGAAEDGRAAASDAAALVRALDDDDPAVRLFAIGGLRRLSDERFGYRWYQDAPGRRGAVAAWERWLEKRLGARAAG
ncbi:hypothetical protein [Phycisphaera mikurensis]|uniref:HEAT repeat domain-containing protein n=1 Tax=Phycisphaera mikurensis (strain NBRC 102666 / KCTC 22515 / FYK2301M01) TaxID=1142394 RepID=I0IGJ4_PHYMF|nr:hypothetical protein [Phycisphaera mikurensis]MBB6442936.1 hypothetical protein [Phycisphaera mikurensis]BAM04382.1 hypothetical protein PSMK_22230 [Phycisphaera mikurensis NBRC 102666]